MKRKISECIRPGGPGYWLSALLLAQGLVMVPVSGALAAKQDNVHFYGALVAEPCVIAPGDEDIQLDFGTIVDKYLYLNTRTLGQSFEIRLIECDLSIGKTVALRLLGTENPALPGLLAIDGGSAAKGIGIGLETVKGTPLLLGQNGEKMPLQTGNNVIALKAYVQGELQALANKHLTRGAFSAVATFSLEYE